MSDTSKITGLNHTEVRTDEQRILMQKIEEDGVCPFCAIHFKKYHPKPILQETNSWFVTTNMSPYEGATYHFLLVYKPEHILTPSEMTNESKLELFTNIEWIISTYKIPGGSFFMRFGDSRTNGSSVEHLHAHLIVGEMSGDGMEPLRVKLGWKQSK